MKKLNSLLLVPLLGLTLSSREKDHFQYLNENFIVGNELKIEGKVVGCFYNRLTPPPPEGPNFQTFQIAIEYEGDTLYTEISRPGGRTCCAKYFAEDKPKMDSLLQAGLEADKENREISITIKTKDKEGKTIDRFYKPHPKFKFKSSKYLPLINNSPDEVKIIKW